MTGVQTCALPISAFNGSIGSLTRVGTQVIAWLCQVPPPLPPNVAHGVQPQASTGDLVTTTPPVVNVAGNWHDSDGFTYTFEQKGSEFSYTQSQNGAQVGTGEGTIAGNTMHYKFQSGDSAGGCIGQVSADNQSISGTCSSGDQNWPFSITR